MNHKYFRYRVVHLSVHGINNFYYNTRWYMIGFVVYKLANYFRFDRNTWFALCGDYWYNIDHEDIVLSDTIRTSI